MRKLLLALASLPLLCCGGSSYTAVIDATRPGAAARVATYAGVDMEVEVQSIQPIAGGHRITLRVRNPSVDPVYGARLALRWTAAGEPRARDINLAASLSPGVWQPVEVALVPSSRRDLASLRLRMVLNTAAGDGRFGPY